MKETTAYTGEVEVGGPTDVRELPGLTITKIATNPFNNNCYLLRCNDTGDQVPGRSWIRLAMIQLMARRLTTNA